MKVKKRVAVLIAVFIFILSGCGISKNTTVVLTSGFDNNEVFYIEHSACTLPEFMVYLVNTKNQYESSFGSEIFEISNNGLFLEDTLKDQVIEKLASVKIMNLLAEDKGIVLTDSEMYRVRNAAENYFSSLNEDEKKYLNVDYEQIEKMYKELAISQKCYDFLIADINPEISDDEARTITVQQIFIKTYFTNENGEKEAISDLAYLEAKNNIEEAYALINEGADFMAVANEYTQADSVTYSFGKNQENEKYEEVAFSLSKGEISEIVEIEDGFYIIKCITTFNKEETDKNKIKIVEERRKEVFEEEYNRFTKTLVRYLNEDLIKSVNILEDEKIVTDKFFQYYDTYID